MTKKLTVYIIFYIYGKSFFEAQIEADWDYKYCDLVLKIVDYIELPQRNILLSYVTCRITRIVRFL